MNIKVDANFCHDNVYLHLYDVNHECDLSFVQAGFHITEKGYSYGPVVRDHYVIHFVMSGEGDFVLQNRSYSISAGYCFLISPHQIAYYKSSLSNPLGYTWLGVSGFKAAKLITQAGFTYENEIRPIVRGHEIEEEFKNFISFARERKTAISIEDTLFLTALSYSILYHLAKSRDIAVAKAGGLQPVIKAKNAGHSQEVEYIRTVVSIIQNSYSENILIEKIAEKIGLNRSYLNSIFKNYTGLSIKKYLTDYRISASKKMLSKQSNSIQEVAFKSGFTDPLYFSRIFKKNTGFSPTCYRVLKKGE